MRTSLLATVLGIAVLGFWTVGKANADWPRGSFTACGGGQNCVSAWPRACAPGGSVGYYGGLNGYASYPSALSPWRGIQGYGYTPVGLVGGGYGGPLYTSPYYYRGYYSTSYGAGYYGGGFSRGYVPYYYSYAPYSYSYYSPGTGGFYRRFGW